MDWSAPRVTWAVWIAVLIAGPLAFLQGPVALVQLLAWPLLMWWVGREIGREWVADHEKAEQALADIGK